MRVSWRPTLTDLLAAIVVVGLLVALVLPAIHVARDAGGHRPNCVSNLKHLGIALLTYHDQFKTFPPGGIRRGDDPTQTHIGVHALLLPYFEESSLHTLYDPTKDWLHQNPQVPAILIPVFVCPSYCGENPIEMDALLNELVLVPGSGGVYTKDQMLGATTYAFCKGVTDAWCHGPDFGRPGPPSVPISERGMFDMNWGMSIRQITDGTSKTIAVGEATGGRGWQLTAASSQRDRRKNAPVDKFGMRRLVNQAWIAMEPSNATLSAQGLYVASVLACTLEPMNENPVTDSWADTTSLDDCRKSLASAPGTRGPTTRDGPHVTPNFRSDHPGGANFLFADGSVHFLADEIDMLVYQRLSTAMDGEPVDIPDN